MMQGMSEDLAFGPDSPITKFWFSRIKPIYAYPNKKRIHAGTGAIFDIDGRVFLITAAHVLGTRNDAQLHFQDLLLTNGHWTSGSSPPDFGAYELSTQELERIPECTILPASAVYEEDPKEGMPCRLLGYPASKNKNFNNAAPGIKISLYGMAGEIAARRSDDLPSTFRVGYEQGKVAPYGMSGGIVATIGQGNWQDFRAIGMPYEYDESDKTVKFTHYKIIVESIRRMLAK